MKLFVPEAVLFDLDGVLLHSISNHFQSWRAILSEQNIEVSERDIALGEGERAEDSLRRFFREKANRTITDIEIEELLNRKRKYFRDSNPPTILSEAETVLKYLHSVNIRMALVSGSAMTNVGHSLSKEDLKLFDTLVTGDLHLPGKPDPAPYLEAMNRLQVQPEKCWVVENAPYGIRAAKTAGAFTIALTTTLPIEDLPGADVYREKIEDIIELFMQAILL